MEELGIQQLTSAQIEKLCTVAELAARGYVHSRVAKRNIETLNTGVEIEGTSPVSLIVDVSLVLSSSMKGVDVQGLADEAVKEAFESAEKYLRELACHSQK